MRFVPVPQALLALLLLSSTTYPQQVTRGSVPQRDAQALAVLTQALNAAGGVTAVAAIQDFTGTGTITYYWAGEEVKGSASIRGKGSAEFRLDATSPDGTRSWAVAGEKGTIIESNGTTSPIPYHNTVHLGLLTLPIARIPAAINDSSVALTYLGSVAVNGRAAEVIRLQHTFEAGADIDGTLTRLYTMDFYIDPGTFLIVKTQDNVYPQRNSQEPYAHELFFSDYRTVNGVSVPYAVKERISAQQTWALQLNSIALNTGLSDADFKLLIARKLDAIGIKKGARP